MLLALQQLEEAVNTAQPVTRTPYILYARSVSATHEAAMRVCTRSRRMPTLGRWTAIRVLTTLKRHGGSELLLRKTDQRPIPPAIIS
jgi:hypothetical protein